MIKDHNETKSEGERLNRLPQDIRVNIESLATKHPKANFTQTLKFESRINKEINKFKSSGNVGLPLRVRFALCAYRRWMARVCGSARRCRGGGTHTAPTVAVMAATTRSPVRRQKCHNNGPWIVFAAPLQIPTETLVRDDAPVISLLLRNSSVLFPTWKKHNVCRTRIRLCHFKHLISIVWELFSSWISVDLISFRIRRMDVFVRLKDSTVTLGTL